jgi:hypothetical protein
VVGLPLRMLGKIPGVHAGYYFCLRQVTKKSRINNEKTAKLQRTVISQLIQQLAAVNFVVDKLFQFLADLIGDDVFKPVTP